MGAIEQIMDKSIYYSDNKFTTLKPSTAPVNKIFYLYFIIFISVF